MLQKNQMVTVKKAVEKLYTGSCTITEHQKVKKANKSTGFKEVVVQKDLPCRLSFQTIKQTASNENGASAMTQVTKLFLDPDIEVKPGSKLTITQNGVTADYKNSGKPAHYTSHQEIILDLWEGWA